MSLFEITESRSASGCQGGPRWVRSRSVYPPGGVYLVTCGFDLRRTSGSRREGNPALSSDYALDMSVGRGDAGVSAMSYGLVAVGCSAGGVRALTRLLDGLPREFSVPVVIVQHLDRRHETVIAEVLGRRSALPVKLAAHEEQAKPGVVYVAPPNRHLLIGAGGTLTLSDSELVHFVRPSVDLLLESAAGAYGSRAIGCVLTGAGCDGAMGVNAIKARGGTVIAEDPESAEFRGMPEAAVSTGAVDFVLPLGEIATVIRRLVEARSP